MGDMGLIFTPVLVRHLLGPPGLSRPMTSISWTHSYSKQSCPPTTYTVRAIHDITVVAKKFAQNPALLASYKR